MAVPKVFVSSTCFDLSEIREQLAKFIRSFGFDPVMSEYGDVFYHPELHTHKACIQEVSNCHMLILIIGGRFGGAYVGDKDKSITNAEYEAARAANIPVFTYIRSSVLANHHLYRENIDQTFVSEIRYQAITKQSDAINIFKFIDHVRQSPVNNAFEGFSAFGDIESHLRKQWAGMFFDFLRNRESRINFESTNALLSGLEASSGKLEALVKSLYRSVIPGDSSVERSIEEIDIFTNLKQFFQEIFDVDRDGDHCVDVDFIARPGVIDALCDINPDGLSLVDYLLESNLFYFDSYDDDVVRLVFRWGAYAYDPEDMPDRLYSYYKYGVLVSTKDQRLAAIKSVLKFKE